MGMERRKNTGIAPHSPPIAPQPETVWETCSGADRPSSVMSDRTVSVAEAAAIAGCSPAVIRRRIESGELDAFADGGAWRVLTDGLSANTPDRRGRSTTRSKGPVASGLADRLMGRPWLLSPDDIAAVIGWPEDQVRYYLRRGYLPGRKLGVRWVCPQDALVAWCEQAVA